MVRIRDAAAADRPAVQELLGQLGYAFIVDEVGARLDVLGASGTDPVLLAVRDGEAVGLVAPHVAAMLQLREPVARITALVPRDGVRGAGVGRLLVDAASELARQSGCRVLELTSAAARTDAYAFSRRLGFTTPSLRFSRPIDAAGSP